MEWFKFYNNKWLSDISILSLNPQKRLVFITLLCVTAQSDERNGVVRYGCEDTIIRMTGLQENVYDDENCDYKKATGWIKDFEELDLIEIIDDKTIRVKNFEKRQETNLSGAERAKRYRDKKKSDERNVTSRDERNAREDKIREDKINNTFDVFWSSFPKKVGKGAAKKAWQKKKPPLDQVLAALEVQKKSKQWQKEDGQFIPNPSTWLNQERWQDEVVTKNKNDFASF